MEDTVFLAPDGQRYSCQQCTFCCRWWRITVEPGKRESILAHDWAKERPSLAGVQLIVEQQVPGRAEPLYQTAHVDGHCVFLEEDGLCLIHKVQGLEAKPLVCQTFPLIPMRTPDGPAIACSYACGAMLNNEGQPLSEQEESGWRLLSDPATEISVAPSEPLLVGKTKMNWEAYRALEGAILEMLGRDDRPAATRLAAVGALVDGACRLWRRKGLVEAEDVRGWVEELRAAGYEECFAKGGSVPRVPPMRQRSVIAPLIADVETADLKASGRAMKAMGYAVSIVNRAGPMPLSTLRAEVELASMKGVAFDQDAACFDDYLTRFLTNFVVRKSLLGSGSLRDGYRYLAICFALVRWYATASAAMGGRSRVELGDLVQGIQVVEKAYAHRMGLRSGARKGLLDMLLNMEMDFFVPPAALIRSYQPAIAQKTGSPAERRP